MTHYETHYATVNPNRIPQNIKEAMGDDLQGNKVRCANKQTKDYYERRYK